MTRYADRYPELYQFFGGYFHQHWTDDPRSAGDSFEDIVRYFQSMNPTDVVRQTARELEEFMGIELSEEELRDVLFYEFGSYVRAPGLGLTYRQWLEAVLHILKNPVRA